MKMSLLCQARTNIKNERAQHLSPWEILYPIETILIMIHCANFIINYSLFLLQGGNISFLAISREIINCGNNSNRKNTLKILASISKPGYLQLDRQSHIRHLCRDTRRTCTSFLLHWLLVTNRHAWKLGLLYASIISGQIEMILGF